MSLRAFSEPRLTLPAQRQMTFEDVFREAYIPLDCRKKVGDFVLGSTIGEGSFSRVRRAKNLITGEQAAIKVLPKKTILKKQSVRRRLIRETRALRQLHHENVVTLRDVMETEANYYLVMDYVKGLNFKDFLSKRSKLEESEARPLLHQMAQTVHYMHSVGIVHRDLKPENFILDGHKLTVVDFGLSALLEDGSAMTTQCGSPAYAAPEIFTGKQYDKSVDIWSLGVILYLMLTETLPFTTDGRSYTQLYSVILRGHDVPTYLSADCVSLLSRMIHIEPKERISTNDLLKHPWLAMLAEENTN